MRNHKGVDGFKVIKLLLIAKDTSKLIIKNYAYLEEALSKLTDLTIWRKPGNIEEILEQIPKKPDFILINDDIGGGFTLNVNGFANIDIPTGLFINDVHQYARFREQYINQNNIQYLFSIVKDRFFQQYPQFKDRFIWFPHFINPAIFKGYGEEKDIELLLMGAVNGWYPMRLIILNQYKDDPRFVYRSHPGYLQFSEQSEAIVGQKYAKELNRAKIFFTCDSILHYPVLKYFESLACKTLLLAPTFPELEELGFIPEKHFVPITKDDFVEKAEYYLANEEERNAIVEAGHTFIMENHTLDVRAEQLVKRIESILNGSWPLV